jgi:hypothetical protein
MKDDRLYLSNIKECIDRISRKSLPNKELKLSYCRVRRCEIFDAICRFEMATHLADSRSASLRDCRFDLQIVSGDTPYYLDSSSDKTSSKSLAACRIRTTSI